MTLRLSPKTREVLDWLDARRRETDTSVEQMCYSERDGGLSTDHAIMRGGPGMELSPPAGSSSPHEAKS